MDDLKSDLSKIKYIKKLITRYKRNGDLQARLILNHIIVLKNVFGAVPTSRILFFNLEDDFDIVKPFLSYLSILPETFWNIGEVGKIVHCDTIPLNIEVIDALRKMMIVTGKQYP